jgi:hypothetical protein
MNIYILSNYAAWILTSLIAAFLLTDFVKNEISSNKEVSNGRRYSDEER